MIDKLIPADGSINNTNNKTTKKRRRFVPLVIWCLVFLLCYGLFFSTANTIVSPAVVTSVEKTIGDIEGIVHIAVERINGIAVKTGTRDKIVTATADVLSEAEERAIAEANLYFDQMLSGVDAYLDWYYSMGGQWAQLWNMVKGTFTGSLSDYMTGYISDRMSYYITPDSDFSQSFSRIQEETGVKIRTLASAIIEENRVDIVEDGSVEYSISIDVTLDDIILSVTSEDFQHAGKIAGAGIVAGFAGNYFAKKMVNKLVTGKVSKMAIKEATEKVVTKAVSYAIPFVGPVVGIAVDYLGTKLDEAFNRNEYREEILAGINSERESVILQIREDFRACSQEVTV